jgi:hypothetical protein
MPWASEGIEPPPADWDPSAQLHAAAVLSPRDDEPFHTCPVCGYRRLFHPPWADDSPSHEICPCCGTHFGYDDFASDEIARATRHRELRNDWSEAGYPWFSSTPMPSDWDPRRQLADAEPVSFEEYRREREADGHPPIVDGLEDG